MDFGISSLVSGIFGMIGQHQQNKNIDKQIAAQAAENQKMREYNLNLAKMQNRWNLDQWNRENVYNLPANQMAILKQGDLNPVLVADIQNYLNAQFQKQGQLEPSKEEDTSKKK